MVGAIHVRNFPLEGKEVRWSLVVLLGLVLAPFFGLLAVAAVEEFWPARKN